MYGFRVDNVHSETYRMLNGINRGNLQDVPEEKEEAEGSDKENQDDQDPEGKKRNKMKIKFVESDGAKTLVTEDKITLSDFDKSH